MANGWLLAFHVLALFLWVGQLLFLSRFLGYHVQEPAAVQARLSRLEQRMYLYICLPGALLAGLTGLLMLHGASAPGFESASAALAYYIKPKLADGTRSFWWVTFHVKLVCVALLVCCDVYLGRQIFRLGRGVAPGASWPTSLLLGAAFAPPALVAVWLPLAAAGVPWPRAIGFGASGVVAVAGFLVGKRLGRADTRARYSVLHAAIAALVMTIVVLMLAKPLAHGGAWLPG